MSAWVKYWSMSPLGDRPLSPTPEYLEREERRLKIWADAVAHTEAMYGDPIGSEQNRRCQEEAYRYFREHDTP